jgi:lysozyme
MFDMTKKFEGCVFTAYPDPGTGATPWTIGFGHTAGVKEGDTCTQTQANVWLASDMANAITAVDRLVTVQVTANQNEALGDFVFNVGQGNFAKSTLLKKINAGDPTASDEFLRWNMAGGKVMSGLIARRQAEKDLFDKDIA